MEENKIIEEVGERMDAILDMLSINANQLAKTLGYERPERIYTIVRRKNLPGFETLKDLNEKLGVNINYMVSGKGEPFNQNNEPNIIQIDNQKKAKGKQIQIDSDQNNNSITTNAEIEGLRQRVRDLEAHIRLQESLLKAKDEIIAMLRIPPP